MSGKIGNDRRYDGLPIDKKRHRGNRYRRIAAHIPADAHFAAPAAFMIGQMLEVALTHVSEQGSSDYAQRALADDAGKGLIAIKDDAFVREGQGSLAHLLDKKAV